MMTAQPQAEHRWLTDLVGDWTFEADMPAAPGQPSQRCQGRERVRSLGGLWIVAEGEGDMPGGGTGQSLMIVGYDPVRQRYVGTWTGSIMAQMWVYEGTRDATGAVLTLETEGPDMSGAGGTARYRDVIDVRSPNHRVLTSQMLGRDGEWRVFMSAHYRRTA
jgi:hypothetical protein